jgi:hypothetical protein
MWRLRQSAESSSNLGLRLLDLWPVWPVWLSTKAQRSAWPSRTLHVLVEVCDAPAGPTLHLCAALCARVVLMCTHLSHTNLL